LSGGFGLIALMLAAIGLGGLLSYVVACRTSEIGVRISLGAAPADLIRMVFLFFMDDSGRNSIF
jgi:ABC-type antimicrobial peptide transport system permease subunit